MIQKLTRRSLGLLKERRYSSAAASVVGEGDRIFKDICIVGGGIVGCATACALASSEFAAGKKITLIEASSLYSQSPILPNVYSNRVSSITPSSSKFLSDIGAWNMIDEARKRPYFEMHVWDAQSEGALDFRKPSSSPIAHIVENRLIQASLSKICASLGNLEVFDNEKVTGIVKGDDSKPIVTLGSGIEISSDLIIGADGPSSKVREYAGIDSVGYDYGQNGLVGTVALEEGNPSNCAWQRFLPSGPVALLPLSDDQSSLVWSLKGDLAHRVAKLPPADFIELLNAAIHNPVEDVQFLLSKISPQGEKQVDFATEAAWGRERAGRGKRATESPPWLVNVAEGSRAPFPLRLRHASQYSGPRVVLVGDAAHTIHPLAGQGLNLGLADAESLSRLLIEAIRNGQDLGDANILSQYAGERYIQNSGMLIACDALSRVFSADNQILSSIRAFGMGAFNQNTGIKQILMKMAS